jgi:hypothetical protein
MSKTKEAIIDQQNEQQPSPYDDLLKNGTAILEAPTREALAELVDNIPADCKYAVGAVGRKGDGSAYTLRVDKI